MHVCMMYVYQIFYSTTQLNSLWIVDGEESKETHYIESHLLQIIVFVTEKKEL